MDERVSLKEPRRHPGALSFNTKFRWTLTVTAIECGLILIGVSIVTLLVLEIFGIRVLA